MQMSGRLVIIGLIVALASVCPSIVAAQSSEFDKAAALFQQRQWEQAAAAFAEVERHQPNQTDALLFRGKSLVNLNRFDDAAEALQAYRKTHPKSEDGDYLLAYVLFRQNRPKDSLELMHQASLLKSPSADDLKIGALDYVLMGDYGDAGRYLEEAVRMAPENAEARYHLGRVRYQQNRFDEAIASFQEVLRLEPNNVKAQDNIGLCLEAKNQMEDAVAAYQKAIEMDKKNLPQSAQPYLDLGALLVMTNRPEEGITHLLKAAEIDQKSSQARYQLGKAYFDLHRYSDAQAAAEEAARLDPKDSATHYLLGRIYQRLNKPELSAKEFQLTEELRQRQESSSGMASGMVRK
jgi:tetratricopeptide (TPR) repeat protein